MAGIIAGAVFTAIVQSSAATVGIAIAMASEGLLALPAGIALALGANIGTAVTTAFMGILSSKSTEATRASVVHVAFNVLGTLIWLPLIWLLVGHGGVDIADQPGTAGDGQGGRGGTAPDRQCQYAVQRHQYRVVYRLHRLVRATGGAPGTGA